MLEPTTRKPIRRTLAWGALAATVALLTAAAGPMAVAAGRTGTTPGLRHIANIKAGVAPLASNLTYHGGAVMRNTSTTYAIFWEPSKLQTGQATHVSSTYNSLIQRYFGDVGGKGLYNVNTQYYQRVGGQNQYIVNSSTLGGAWVDRSPYPASGCVDPLTPGNCLSDAQIQAEVRKAMSTKGWTGGLTHLFFVFTSYGEGSCADVITCAFTYYCAYHSYFSSGGTVLYANMPYTGTDLNGCGTPTSPNNDFDADSTINVTSHEHMEAVTDPRLNAWYDSSGNENGDKCAWNFGPMRYDGGRANQSWNGHYYILQMEWDNKISNCAQSGP